MQYYACIRIRITQLPSQQLVRIYMQNAKFLWMRMGSTCVRESASGPVFSWWFKLSRWTGSYSDLYTELRRLLYSKEFRADIFLELKAIAIHKIHTCILTYIHSFMHAFIYRDRHTDRHRDRPKDTTQNIAYQHIFLSLGLMDGVHVYSDVWSSRDSQSPSLPRDRKEDRI